jgi:hypothetical protein
MSPEVKDTYVDPTVCRDRSGELSGRAKTSWKPFFERVVATRTQAENHRETSVGLTQDHEWSGIRLVLTGSVTTPDPYPNPYSPGRQSVAIFRIRISTFCPHAPDQTPLGVRIRHGLT